MIRSTLHTPRPKPSTSAAAARPKSLPSSSTPSSTPANARSGDSVSLSSEALAANVDPNRCGNDWRCLEKIWDQLA